MGLVEVGANSFIHVKLQSVSPDINLLTLMHRFASTIVDIVKRSWLGLLTHYLTVFIDTSVSYQTPLIENSRLVSRSSAKPRIYWWIEKLY
jgi:hypothetical protein